MRHQVIHVVNGFPVPATVRIDNQPAFQVPNGHLTFILAEGRHLAHVSGPVTEEIAFELRSGLWNPPPPGEAPVLNLGGHAILMKRRVQSGLPP